MKTQKLFSAVSAFLVAAVILTAGSFANAQFEPPAPETVKGMILNNLGVRQGENLTVLYVKGTPAAVRTNGRQIHIDAIKATQGPRPVNGSSIRLDSVQLPPKSGIFEAYSYSHIVFVFHAQPVFKWVNAVDLVRNPDSLKPENAYRMIYVLSREQLLRLGETQGSPEFVTIAF
jgi:hypothetical protein